MATACSLTSFSMQNYDEIKKTLQSFEELNLCYQTTEYLDLKQDLHKRLDKLQEIITSGINSSSSEGETPLLTAVRFRDTETARRLLDHNPKLHGHANFEGGTVLHYAIKYQSYDCIRELIQKRPILLDTRNNSGLSPYQYSKTCIAFHNAEIAQSLKRNYDVVSEKFSMKNYKEVKKSLKTLDKVLFEQKKAQIKSQMQQLQEFLSQMQKLIKNGLNGPDERGGTPLHAAAFAGDVITLRKLFALGADAYICEPGCNASLLHVAVAGQNTDCVLEVLKVHSKLAFAKNNLGYTPFEYSCSFENKEITELLQSYTLRR